MFNLTSLSSPSGLFKTIEFKSGLNIILGRYSKSGKDINGIGKSTIINLIDYCLLSEGVKTEIFKEKYSFLRLENIVLKFTIGSNQYAIKRGFEDKRSVYFTINDDKPKEFVDSDLRLILGAEIGRRKTGIFEPVWFRTLMSFFIQNDHSFLQRDADNVLKFTVGKRQPELFTYVFLLLGIDNSLIWKFDNSSVELKSLRSDQSRIKKQVTEQTGKSIEEFRGECDSVARKIDRLENGLDNYEFDENSLDLEEKIKTLNTKISSLNKKHLALAEKYKDIQEGLEIDLDVDPDHIASLYSRINAEFSEYIRKSLDEIIAFRREISTNRRRFLKERESHYQGRLDEIKYTLISIEKERSKFYKMLDEKSTFDALKAAYINLIEEKGRLSGQLAYIEQLNYIEEEIARKKSSLSETVASLVAEKSAANDIIGEVKNTFLDIVEGSVDVDESDVKPYINIEFQSRQNSPVRLSLEVPRGSSLGKGRFKILAFDLTVFLVSVKRQNNFPGFLVHDGVFHAIAHKTRIKFLNFINKKLDEFDGVQYIITVNEDEIIFPESDGVSAELDFDLSEKCLITLEDNPDNMFLGREFG